MIAFRYWTSAPTMTSMVIEPDGDWDLLKIEMCRAWNVERLFNSHDVWSMLREGHVVLIESALYQVYSDARDDATGLSPFEMFNCEGEHTLLRLVDAHAEPWNE